MYEYNYYKSINIESENLKISKELTKNCIIEVKKMFERLFSNIDGFNFSSSVDKNNVFIFTVTNNNFNAKLRLEMTNDICYVRDVEDKYLSLYISSFAGAFSLEKIKKISKEIKFWFTFLGFFLGTILALPIAYWYGPNPGKTAFSGRGMAFIVFLVFFSFGFIFLKIGTLIGKLITNYEKNILNKNSAFQKKLEIWEKFINEIQMFFEEKYYISQ